MAKMDQGGLLEMGMTKSCRLLCGYIIINVICVSSYYDLKCIDINIDLGKIASFIEFMWLYEQGGFFSAYRRISADFPRIFDPPEISPNLGRK